MGDLRCFVSFECDLPIDVGQDEAPGRSIADLVISTLRDAGVEIVGPSDEGSWAWTFSALVAGSPCECVLGLVDDGPRQWLITTEYGIGLFRRLRGESPIEAHRGFCVTLNRALRATEAFRTIRWYTPTAWNNSPDDSWTENPATG